MIDNELKEHCLQEAGIDLGRYSYNELNVIKDALRRYHNAKLKLLSIDDGSGSLQINWDDVYEEANHRSPAAFDEYVKSICNDRITFCIGEEADLYH